MSSIIGKLYLHILHFGVKYTKTSGMHFGSQNIRAKIQRIIVQFSHILFRVKIL